MTKDYNSTDIISLSDQEHVRLRTQIYLGNMHPQTYNIPMFTSGAFEIKQVEFIPAVYKAVGEIIDNAVDEFAQNGKKKPILEMNVDTEKGQYHIKDNGRGIPIDMHESGVYTPEVALGSLRSGRNFTDDNGVGVIGQNGVGSACTNFCSTKFEVTVQRDKKVYSQMFTNGGVPSKPTISPSSARQTGTSVEFTLDPAVFSTTSLPAELMSNRASEIAFTNPGLRVTYNKTKLLFNNGLSDVVNDVSSHSYPMVSDIGEFYLIFDVNNSDSEQMFTWVNSSLLFDGGICNTQFLNALCDATIQHLQPQAKKQKCKITKPDVLANLLILSNMKVSDPEYDAQSKTRLTGPNLRKEFVDLVQSNWAEFAKQNKAWLDEVVVRATKRYHSTADTTAIKNHESGLKRKVEGLLDANNKNREKCQLLVTEGLSAASSISDVRDAATTAALPLSGKINNIHGCTVSQILAMPKVQGLLSAVRLIPGKKALRSTLRYGKLVIATDSDYDGNDIFTLLINLLFAFWPELFDSNRPFVYRLVAPNVCVIKGKKRIHFTSLEEFEKHKSKYSGWQINYYKGLGSMESIDWEMILKDNSTLIPIVDDGKVQDTLKLLFSDDADARKDWLQQ